MAKGTMLKRFILGLFAAVTALVFARKKAAAPGGKDGEFKLAPVPDARASGPEDSTPLTEEEQEVMAERAPEFKGFSAPPHAGVPIDEASDPDASTPLTEDEQAEFSQRQGVSGSDETPAPISYEISKQNADEAEALREAGDTEAAGALEERVYFTAPETSAGHDLDPEMGDDPIGDGDDTEAAEEPQDVAAPESSEEKVDSEGDTTPEPTSESFDIVTDGADHTGQDAAEIEDPTSVGLDINVDLDDDDEEIVPELTSEAFDGGREALGIAAGQPENTARGFVKVPSEQNWCPDDYPIKGNATSRIYHMPGESSYDATDPELCFADEESAAAQGFRPRKR